MATLSLKKVLVVAVLGAVLFVASFVVSERIHASNIFCEFTGGCGPVDGPAGGPVGGAVGGGQLMTASYYGYAHAGLPTASGDLFDPEGFTAAHKTMEFGTQLRVSHGGNSVTVAVNDRGPFTEGRDLDLSQAAAETIGLTGPGVAPVEATIL